MRQRLEIYNRFTNEIVPNQENFCVETDGCVYEYSNIGYGSIDQEWRSDLGWRVIETD